MLPETELATERPRMALLSQAKGRAKDNKLPFNITINDIVIPSTCPVLDIPIITAQDSEQIRSGPTDNSPSIDRIIPELGYIRGNVMVISNRANRIKGDGTLEEHKKIANYIGIWKDEKD